MEATEPGNATVIPPTTPGCCSQWYSAMLLLLLLAVMPAGAAVPALVVVAEPHSAHQQDFIRGLEAGLAGAAELEQRAPDEVAELDNTAVVVAVGQRAGEVVARQGSGQWRLYGLVPRATARAWLDGDPRAAARVVDQPPSRQVALLTAVLPEVHHVGLLLGPGSRHQAARLVRMLEAVDRRPTVREVERASEVEAAVDELLGEVEALIVPADPVVINRRTAVPLIQGAYLRGVPLLGPGRSSVRAGALMALHTEPEALGREAAMDVRAALDGQPPTGQHHPQDFRVVVNYGVARALGLAVPPERELQRRVREKRP